MPLDYTKGKIYTIRCRNNDTMIYVGSTIETLTKRLGNHKRQSRTERNKHYLIYQTINEDWDNWYIELHTLYPCNSKEELHRKEGEITRLIGNLNMRIAGRTQEDYRMENKDKMAEYNKDYYDKNKDKIKDDVKNYLENNKEEIYNKKKEKITCDCGCLIRKANILRHRKSQKHLNAINIP